MIDAGAAYERCRRALLAELRACSDAELARPVPATPDWTIHDVLAHVVGLAADLNAQHLPEPDDLGGTAWSTAQVAARAQRTVAELAAEWDAEAPAFEDGLRLFGIETGRHFVADLAIHLVDVRQARWRGAGLDPEALRLGLDHYLAFVDERLRALGFGVLAVRIGDDLRLVGGPGAQARATVAAPPFDLFRSLAARRSAHQVRALDWSGDVDAAIDALGRIYTGGYSMPAQDLPPEAP